MKRRVADRDRLEQLTERWRARHEARRPTIDARPPAGAEREALAAGAFPYRSVAPAAYIAEHGAAMRGFTFDDLAYCDPELDAWILEVGRLLRAARDPA